METRIKIGFKKTDILKVCAGLSWLRTECSCEVPEHINEAAD